MTPSSPAPAHHMIGTSPMNTAENGTAMSIRFRFSDGHFWIAATT
jgi:hypothetical protein